MSTTALITFEARSGGHDVSVLRTSDGYPNAVKRDVFEYLEVLPDPALANAEAFVAWVEDKRRGHYPMTFGVMRNGEVVSETTIEYSGAIHHYRGPVAASEIDVDYRYSVTSDGRLYAGQRLR
jgi:hypothetical protein